MNEREMRMRRQLQQRMNRGRGVQAGAQGQAQAQRARQARATGGPVPRGPAPKGSSPFALEQNLLNAKLGNLMPGNVGDINKIVWPFFFTMPAPTLAPATASQSSFTVSQEAAFIWMSFTKVVFLRTGTSPNFVYTAIDPNDETGAGDANGLNVQFRDAQSSRVFQKNPMPLDSYGVPEFPTVLSTPMMFLPNSTVEALFNNSDATNVYVPWVTFFGYRVRVENAQDILSLVTG